MSILKITSTGVECRPTLPELGWRLSRSAFTRLNSWSSSSSSSRRASWGSNSSSSLGTISKRFTGSYPSTIMVASLLWRFLGIGILQERPISHRKLDRRCSGARVRGHDRNLRTGLRRHNGRSRPTHRLRGAYGHAAYCHGGSPETGRATVENSRPPKTALRVQRCPDYHLPGHLRGRTTRAGVPSGSIGCSPNGPQRTRDDGRDADRRHTCRIRVRRPGFGNRGDSGLAGCTAGHDVDLRNCDRSSYRRTYHVHLRPAVETRAMEQCQG